MGGHGWVTAPSAAVQRALAGHDSPSRLGVRAEPPPFFAREPCGQAEGRASPGDRAHGGDSPAAAPPAHAWL